MHLATPDEASFERFNQASGAGSIRDPYPFFAELRRQGPVAQMDPAALAAGSPLGEPAAGIGTITTAVSYDAVAEVLRDGRRFSSAGYAFLMGPVMGHTILEMDEPEHARVRGLIQQAFGRKALERWEEQLVGPVIDALLDRLLERRDGRAELVRELTFPFPVMVIAGMMGLDEADFDDFHRWAVELISVNVAPDEARAASAELSGLFGRVLAERRREPRDDLVSVLATARLDDGAALSDEEIFAFLKLLAPAGAETTYRSSSNLLFGLLSRPEQLEDLRGDAGLIPQAIDEGLRWEAPLTSIMRSSTEDTEVCGVPIPANTMVQVSMGAANRDESRWDDPDRFDIHRPLKAHIAFAFGPHRCLGIHLATLETRVLLERLLARLPGLRLDPEAEDVHITGMAFRAPRALPVRYDPAADR